MKKLLSALVLLSLSSTVMANAFEDKVDQQELAQALIKCSGATLDLFQGREFVNTIEGKHTNISKGVDQKVITIKTANYLGFGRTVPGKTVVITETVTQPPVGSFDMPSRVVYDCEIQD